MTGSIVKELRALGIVSMAERLPAPPPYDADAERQIVSSIWDGAPVPPTLRGAHFFCPLLARLFVFVAEARADKKEPSVTLAVRWLEQAGYPAPRLAAYIEDVIATPSAWKTDALAERIIRLARHRKAHEQLARAAALLSVPETESGEVARVLRTALSALGAGPS